MHDKAVRAASTGPTWSHVEYLEARRFPVLDGLRAIAILLVFTSHPRYELWGRLHGDTGVTLFFVLSGFLITTLLLREETRYGRVGLRAFFIRRVFRIYPMFFGIVALYCVLIIGLGMDAARRDLFVDNLSYTFLFFPEHMEFFPVGGVHSPNAATWSIGVEEKFYLVWPLLGFLVMLKHPRARMPFLVVVAVLSFACNFFHATRYLSPYEHLAFGSMVALLLHSPRTYDRLAVLGRGPVLATVAAAAVVFQLLSTDISPNESLYGVHGIVIAVLLTGLVVTRSRGVGWLSSRPLVFLAAISYVFYLTHNFALNATEAVIPVAWGLPGSVISTLGALVVACVVSWVIHRLYEEPLRKLGVRLASRLPRPGQVERADSSTLDSLTPRGR